MREPAPRPGARCPELARHVVRERARADALAPRAVPARRGGVLKRAPFCAQRAREAVPARRGAAREQRLLRKVLRGGELRGGEVRVVAVGPRAVALELAGHRGVQEAAGGAVVAVGEVGAHLLLVVGG